MISVRPKIQGCCVVLAWLAEKQFSNDSPLEKRRNADTVETLTLPAIDGSTSCLKLSVVFPLNGETAGSIFYQAFLILHQGEDGVGLVQG